MCIICVEIQKGKLRTDEATRNLTEMRTKIGKEHAEEVEELIVKTSLKHIDEMLEEYFGYLTLPWSED